MNSTRYSRLRAVCAAVPLLLAALGASAPAHAQYGWIDEHGTRVFSDRPPPAGTPPSRILQAPRGQARPAPLPDTDKLSGPAPNAEAAGAQPQRPTLADRDAAFRQRAAQRDADERKAADEARRQADVAAHCAAARREEAALGTGRRLTGVDDKGERFVLSDEETARRLAQASRALADCP